VPAAMPATYFAVEHGMKGEAKGIAETGYDFGLSGKDILDTFIQKHFQHNEKQG